MLLLLLNYYKSPVMKEVNMPEGYQAVMPYLILKDALKFFDFTSAVFNAEKKTRTLRDDQTLMHGEVSIVGSTIMFAEATDEYKVQNAGMFVYVDDCDNAYQLALDAGSQSIMPPADQSYGRSAGVTDPFGNTWWITSAQ